jgi:arylsulfatase A-like enzyme
MFLSFALALLPLQSPASPPAAAPQPTKRSVLLITLDTTRRDYVGFMGRSPSPTPTLDELAARSVVFDDAQTTVPLTLPAHTSLMTGLYPASHGVRDNALYRVPSEARTLAEILSEHGYAARASVAAFVLDPAFGLDQGFERYRAPPRAPLHGGSALLIELDARQQVDRALEDLAELTSPPAGPLVPRPFLYWLHLFDAHCPYAAPEKPVLPPEVAADPKLANKARYEAEIRHMDGQLARLFAHLRETKLLDELVIVVTADHGESLYDSPEASHGFFLFDPTVRVPLLLRHPDLAARRVAVPASLVDVTPTLLDLLGVDAAGERFEGIDLAPWIRDPGRAPPERSLMLETLATWNTFGWAPLVGCTHDALKYVRSATESLYDRAADATERTNLFQRGEPRSIALSRQVDAHLAGAHPFAAESAGLSDADRAKLQALGYGGGGTVAALPEDWSSLPDPATKTASMERFNQAFAVEAKGDVMKAIELLRPLAADEPRSAAVREQLGMMLFNAGPAYVDEAAKELDATLALDPRRARSWCMRASCADLQATKARAAAQRAREQGQAKEAREFAERERAARELVEPALRKSLECEPDYPDALQLLARTLADRAEQQVRRGDVATARSTYAEVLQLAERLVSVLPSSAPGWAEAAAARARVKSRVAELGSR